MSVHSTSSPDLLTVADEAHAQTSAALGDRPLEAVAWCSAHLYAVDRVLYRKAKGRAPKVPGRLKAAREADHALQQALHRLDRHVTGAVQPAHLTVQEASEQVRAGLVAHAAAERQLIRALDAVLTPQERRQLAERLQAAATLGPTRPHPYARPGPLLGTLDAFVDRIRDTLDNRLSPTGRPVRAARPPGRWGCYLMGVPYPEDAHDPAAEKENCS